VEDGGTSVQDPAKSIDFRTGLGVSTDGDGADVTYEHAEVFEGREGGEVTDTNQGVLIIDSLADGETVEIFKATLTNADGSAVATGVDLELVTMDNAGAFTSQAVILSGDGATVYDDETGQPLSTFTNTSGGAQTIAVLVDNQSGAAVNILASVEGVTGA
jgi:hypothetical protein